MSRPVVLVVASPYVGATALGRLLRQRDRYDVVVPDVGAGEEVPAIDFDAVVTTLPLPQHSAPVVIELPWNWEAPVRVTVHDVKEELHINGANAMVEVLAVLDRCLFERSDLRTSPNRTANTNATPGPRKTKEASL